MDLKWRISHIRGYLELEMYREAEQELNLIPEDDRHSTAALIMQVAVFHQTHRWRRLAAAAQKLVERQPENAEWWISLAFAVRRGRSIRAARKILLQAEALHPAEATIQFNLACYACQLGELAEAHERVNHAVRLDPTFREMALEDPDLIEIRDSLR